MTKAIVVALVVLASMAAISPAEARGGCGWGNHRGWNGGCYRNGTGPAVVVGPRAVVVAPGAAVVVAPRACPIGYHLGPYGHHCFPN